MFHFVRNRLPLAAAFVMAAGLAHAQGVDVFFGVGTDMAESSHSLIDTFGNGTNYTTPRLGGSFGKVGADFFFLPQLGVNAEGDFRFSQGAYAGLNYRPSFYDANLVWKPHFFGLHRVEPVIEGGLGGMHLSFYESGTSCDAFAGCATSSAYVEGSNHFQVHLAAGLRIYATRHVFFQPQVDARYVNNLFQFGTNWVPEYGASVGWNFGER